MKNLIYCLLASGLLRAEAYGQVPKRPVTKHLAASHTSYEAEVGNFIKQVIPNLTAEFVLVDKPISIESVWANDCLKQVLADKVSYSAAELAGFQSHPYPVISSWASFSLGARLLNQDTIRKAFQRRADDWDYFHKHIGGSFNEFSAPIFLRNYTYCLFYSANYCGSLCAGGSLMLYKKEKGIWKPVKAYCQWIS
ncbi:MAG: hypothetical protein EOO60_12940 [Hymenobacter sp.]|nr:MAG: hypothetical protein EOO60_12940 [Hymenobacter sp.]